MPDWLDKLAKNTLQLVANGYYSTHLEIMNPPKSLKESLLLHKGAALISEIKFASPSKGIIREVSALITIAKAMIAGGVAGLSIITEPNYFRGNIEFIYTVRSQIEIPILMKDFFLSTTQIDTASKIGASAILLIHALFDRGYGQSSIPDLISYAHSKGIEVLLEVHSEEELIPALNTEADMIGINNRNLKTLKIDLKTTKDLLTNKDTGEKLIVSESGVSNPEDIQFLRSSGAHAFLIGTTIMQSSNISEKIQELRGVI